MKKLNGLTIHFIGWAIVLFVFNSSYLFRGPVSPTDIALTLSITSVQAVEFYICYLWVFPRFMKPGKILLLIAGMLFALAAFICMRYLIEEILYPILLGIRNYSPDTAFLDYARDNVYFGGGYIIISGAIWGIVQAYSAEKRHALLQAESKKAELAFLRSQINPHFLYNTLNYLYSLAIPVSDQLSKAILRLSDLMRYTLSDSPDGKVMVDREIEYLDSYIALFRMRFEPAFYVHFNQEGASGQKIAPLLLVPLVENAFKHGVVNDPASPILIILRIKNNVLFFSVENKINHSQKDQYSGIGLTNIERRLQLLYPGLHELNIETNNNYYKAALTIKLDEV